MTFLYAALTFAMNDPNCKKTTNFENGSDKKGAPFFNTVAYTVA